MEIAQTCKQVVFKMALALLRRGKEILIVRNSGGDLWSLPGPILREDDNTEEVLANYLKTNLPGLRVARGQKLEPFFSFSTTDEIGTIYLVEIFQMVIARSKIQPNKEEVPQISFQGLDFICDYLFENGQIHPAVNPLLSHLSRQKT